MSNQGGNTGCSQTRNTREAAARVGLSYSMLTKLRVTGGGPPFYKLGARVVYQDPDLDAWMESRKQTSTSEYS